VGGKLYWGRGPQAPTGEDRGVDLERGPAVLEVLVLGLLAKKKGVSAKRNS